MINWETVLPLLFSSIPGILVALYGYKVNAARAEATLASAKTAARKDELETVRNALTVTINELTARLENAEKRADRAEQRTDRVIAQRDAERAARDADVKSLRDQMAAMDTAYSAKIRQLEQKSEEDQDRIGYLTRCIAGIDQWLKDRGDSLPEHLLQQRRSDPPILPQLPRKGP